MSDYPDDLKKQDYYDEILGPPPEPDEINSGEPTKEELNNARYFIGLNKPKVERRRQDFNMPSQFEGSDNMPNDPEQADMEDITHA